MRVYAIEHTKATLGQFGKQIQGIYRTREQAKEFLKDAEKQLFDLGYTIRESTSEWVSYYSEDSTLGKWSICVFNG
jgi:hypothetical protein